jgi:hypothetical protein
MNHFVRPTLLALAISAITMTAAAAPPHWVDPGRFPTCFSACAKGGYCPVITGYYNGDKDRPITVCRAEIGAHGKRGGFNDDRAGCVLAYGTDGVRQIKYECFCGKPLPNLDYPSQRPWEKCTSSPDPHSYDAPSE